MTKAELIERIARSRDLPPEVTKKDVAKVLDLAFAELAGYFVRSRVTRSSNPRFTFPKFGTFTKKQRSGRRGVNPRTLEPIEIEACETVDFKPSVELKRQLNEAANAKPSKARGLELGSRQAGADKSARTTESAPAKEPVARKKKAARTSAKRKPSLGVNPPVSKPDLGKPHAAGPGGRKLVTREDAELELPLGEPLLPNAPMRRVARARKPIQTDTDLGNLEDNDSSATGT